MAECPASVALPDGETVTCNQHKLGWHLCIGRATWPEQLDPQDEHCMAWTRRDTAVGLVFVACGKVPHSSAVAHHANLGGMPVVWTS